MGGGVNAICEFFRFGLEACRAGHVAITFLLTASVISGGLGHCAVSRFHNWQKGKLDADRKRQGFDSPNSPVRVDPWVTGLIERIVFALVVACIPEQAVTAIGGWIVMKMAMHWQSRPRFESDSADADVARQERQTLMVWNSYAILALLSTLLSMAFAAAGGAIALYIVNPDDALFKHLPHS